MCVYLPRCCCHEDVLWCKSLNERPHLLHMHAPQASVEWLSASCRHFWAPLDEVLAGGMLTAVLEGMRPLYAHLPADEQPRCVAHICVCV